MERKSAAGNIRNRERSKKKFLDAVGKILRTKGYTALKVNSIAAAAGVDKKMIYSYFGGIDGLIDEYIESQDYWNKIMIEEIKPQVDDRGKSFMENTFFSQFDYIHSNKEAQKLLLWRLSESRRSLKKFTETQGKNGEYIFKLLIDFHFKNNAENVRAIMAIMTSGLYYLNMYAEINGSIFCGIDVSTTKGRDEIKKAVSFLLHYTCKNL